MSTGFWWLPHRLIWNQKVFSNEPKFKDVYSGNNLSEVSDGAYVINIDQYRSVG